jgi:hypothetical protein
MKRLSEQLSQLSDRVEKTAEFVAVARGKKRRALDSPRELLKFAIGDGTARAEAAAAQSQVQSWWDAARSSTNSSLATSFDSASPSASRARRAGSTFVAREKTR